jgi:hypothetical protein
MSIQSIIEEAIGEDIPKEFEIEGNHYSGYNHEFAIGCNTALQDLRNKIPEIEKKIVEEIEKTVENEILIHKQLQTECVGSLGDLLKGIKKEDNTHNFVIEQETILKERIIKNLTS